MLNNHGRLLFLLAVFSLPLFAQNRPTLLRVGPLSQELLAKVGKSEPVARAQQHISHTRYYIAASEILGNVKSASKEDIAKFPRGQVADADMRKAFDNLVAGNLEDRLSVVNDTFFYLGKPIEYRYFYTDSRDNRSYYVSDTEQVKQTAEMISFAKRSLERPQIENFQAFIQNLHFGVTVEGERVPEEDTEVALLGSVNSLFIGKPEDGFVYSPEKGLQYEIARQRVSIGIDFYVYDTENRTTGLLSEENKAKLQAMLKRHLAALLGKAKVEARPSPPPKFEDLRPPPSSPPRTAHSLPTVRDRSKSALQFARELSRWGGVYNFLEGSHPGFAKRLQGQLASLEIDIRPVQNFETPETNDRFGDKRWVHSYIKQSRQNDRIEVAETGFGQMTEQDKAFTFLYAVMSSIPGVSGEQALTFAGQIRRRMETDRLEKISPEEVEAYLEPIFLSQEALELAALHRNLISEKAAFEQKLRYVNSQLRGEMTANYEGMILKVKDQYEAQREKDLRPYLGEKPSESEPGSKAPPPPP